MLKYRIEYIGAEDGLSQGSVYLILKNFNRYRWFGSTDGLNLWNGKTMEVYRPLAKDKFRVEGIEIKKIVGLHTKNLLMGDVNCMNMHESENG
jgi:hypothetical protein